MNGDSIAGITYLRAERIGRPAMKKLELASFAVILVFALAMTAQAQDKKVRRSIEHISGGLYKFNNNFHSSVFLVTDEGIIATDPINVEAAASPQIK